MILSKIGRQSRSIRRFSSVPIFGDSNMASKKFGWGVGIALFLYYSLDRNDNFMRQLKLKNDACKPVGFIWNDEHGQDKRVIRESYDALHLSLDKYHDRHGNPIHQSVWKPADEELGIDAHGCWSTRGNFNPETLNDRRRGIV